MKRGVPSLRTRRFVRAFRARLARACERGEFRVVHYSVQRDHAHLLVEAAGKAALGRGMKSVGARFARAVQAVYGGRYHLRVLRTPREVRAALAYVLNVRKHWKQRFGAAPPRARFDEASSARWFDGWSARPERGSESAGDTGPPEVARAHTWLLARGWRRHGLLDPAEVPGLNRRARAKRGPKGRSRSLPANDRVVQVHGFLERALRTR